MKLICVGIIYLTLTLNYFNTLSSESYRNLKIFEVTKDEFYDWLTDLKKEILLSWGTWRLWNAIFFFLPRKWFRKTAYISYIFLVQRSLLKSTSRSITWWNTPGSKLNFTFIDIWGQEIINRLCCPVFFSLSLSQLRSTFL